jgi:hypothetical protein
MHALSRLLPLPPPPLHAPSQVFGPFGGLLRVLLFMKSEQLCALVEYGSVDTAVAALNSLGGQYLYPYVPPPPPLSLSVSAFGFRLSVG